MTPLSDTYTLQLLLNNKVFLIDHICLTSDWARVNRMPLTPATAGLAGGRGSGRTAQITSMDYVNAHEDALLLVASDDGSVRLFKDQCDDEEDEGSFYTLINHKLVSAWNGLRDVQAWNRAGGHGLAALMPAAGTEGTILQVGAWRLQGNYYRF